jgi:hypothetical protein
MGIILYDDLTENLILGNKNYIYLKSLHKNLFSLRKGIFAKAAFMDVVIGAFAIIEREIADETKTRLKRPEKAAPPAQWESSASVGAGLQE